MCIRDRSNSQTSEDIFNLNANNYNVSITDDNGCLFQDVYQVNQPYPLLLNVVSQDVTCTDGNDGSVDLNHSGGVGPYTYQWDNGMTSQDINSLNVSLYTVLVTDDHGCQETIQANVNQPSNPLVPVSYTHLTLPTKA